MSYATLGKMRNSQGLRERLTAAAAKEAIDTPDAWVGENLWKLIVQPGWEDDWQYARDTMTVNHNPDIGARDDVISDTKILGAVQAVRSAELAS